MFRFWSTASGVIILALTFWQIFADLFHPTAQGSLSDWITRGLWRAMRWKQSVLGAVGPLALLVVIVAWVSLVALGFALIYWPALPDFKFTGQPERGFLTAGYISLEALTALGLSDSLPQPRWLRFTVTFEAMIGLGLVTACVSWTVLLYPALGRLRLLARQVFLLHDAAERTRVPVIAAESEYLLHELAEKVLQARADLIYFPILYYFHAARSQTSLANALPVLKAWCDKGCTTSSDRVRFAAEVLQSAIAELTELIGERFLNSEQVKSEEVLDAYADDHRAASGE